MLLGLSSYALSAHTESHIHTELPVTKPLFWLKKKNKLVILGWRVLLPSLATAACVSCCQGSLSLWRT